MSESTQPTTWRGGALLPVGHARSGVGDASLHGSPELTLTLGRDRHSSGVSVWLRVPTGGNFPHRRLLMSERWASPLPGEVGCVELAIQALQSLLGELRGLQDGEAST